MEGMMYLLDGIQTRPLEFSILRVRWTAEAVKRFALALRAQQSPREVGTLIAVAEALTSQATTLEEWWKEARQDKAPDKAPND